MNCEQPPLFPSELLLDFLQKESSRRALPEDLWNQLELQYGDRVYSELLFFLTQTHFEPPEAREHWQAIMNHQSTLKGIIGRDVGLRVALADFFINLHPVVENPMILEISRYLNKEQLTMRDELTGLYNRRYFNHVLQQEIDRSRRFDEPVSLLMLDIDYFKKFNDTYGHVAGDQVLAELADIFRQTSRSIDHLTRYGGEEFAFILPRCNDQEAFLAAERHRLAVAEHSFSGKQERKLSVSIGLASYPQNANNPKELVERADQALYVSKRKQRNMVYNFASDQRRHHRFPIVMDLFLKEKGNGWSKAAGKTKNISFGGLLGETDTFFEPGIQMEIALKSQDHRMALHLQGLCMRVEECREECPSRYHLGISFSLSNTPEEEGTLKALIGHLNTV